VLHSIAAKILFMNIPWKTNIDCNVITLNLNESYQEAVLRVGGSRVGIEVPAKKDLNNARASFGLCRGTSCPAPLTFTNVSPAYSWVHPATSPSSYHARQGLTVGSLRASME